MIDLQPFCGTDDSHPYLMKPFSREGFTWATDSHILLRVVLRNGVPDHDQKLNLAKQFARLDTATFFRPRFNLPPAPVATGQCEVCDGVGCTAEGDACLVCKGWGDLNPEKWTSTSVGPKVYCLHYIRQILSLPDVELAHMQAEPLMKPLLFRFNGGIGALMPMSSQHADHVEIEPR